MKIKTNYLILMANILFPTILFAQTTPVQILEQIKKEKKEDRKVDLYHKLTTYYAYQPDSVIKYASKGLKVAELIGNEKEIATMQYIYGVGQMNINQCDTALGHFASAEKIALKQHNYILLGRLARVQGLSYLNTRRFDKAIAYEIQAINYLKKAGNYTDIPMCYSIIGGIYSNNTQSEKAIEYNLKALHSLEKLMADKSKKYNQAAREQFEINYIDFNGNLAGVYQDIGRYELALVYFKRVLKKGKTTLNMQGYAIIQGNASFAYYKLGDKKMANSLARHALSLSQKHKMIIPEANALLHLGLFSSDLTKASSYFRQAVLIAKQIPENDLIKTIYKRWSEKAEQKGNYSLALKTYQKFSTLKDSLMDSEQLLRIGNLESSLKLKETVVELQQAELVSAKAHYENKRILIAAIFLAGMLIIAFLFYLRTRKLNQALSAKSKQLEELNNFKSKVFSVIGHDVSGPISSMSAILYILKKNQSDEQERNNMIDRLSILNAVAFEMLNRLFVWGSGNFISAPKKLLSLPKDIMHTIQVAERFASTKQVSIDLQYDHCYHIKADREHLEFILRNLLTNAVKFSDQGGKVTISLSSITDLLSLTVENQGTPFQKDLMSKLFSEQTNEISSDAIEKGKGTGLVFCRKIAELEGFELKLAKADEVSTRFELIIPDAVPF